MSDHIVAEVSEIKDGERILVELKGREIGVFYLDGGYYAFANWCAHQGGPWCEGNLTGTFSGKFDRSTLEYRLDWIKEGRILNCPWHGWEYDMRTGRHAGDSRMGLRPIKVFVREEKVYLII